MITDILWVLIHESPQDNNGNAVKMIDNTFTTYVQSIQYAVKGTM